MNNDYTQKETEILEKGEATLKWEVEKSKIKLELLGDFLNNTYVNKDKEVFEPYEDNVRMKDFVKNDTKLNGDFNDTIQNKLENLDFSNKEIIEITKSELPTFIVIYDNDGKDEIVFANHDEDKYVDTTVDLEELIGKDKYENFDFSHPDSFLDIPNVTIMYEEGKGKDSHWETYDLSSSSFDNFTDNLVSELKETVLKDELNAIKDEVKEDIINHSELNYMKRNEMDNLTEKYEKAQAEPTQNLKHFETLQKEQNTEKEFE